MAEIINGKDVSAKVRKDIALEVEKLRAESNIIPGLAVVLVGDDPASSIYVRNKHRACLEVGMNSYEFRFPADVDEKDILKKIDELNCDPTVHGILVQLPLPEHIDERKVIERISPDKDVDSFHPENVGRIMIGEPYFLPCTPAGIMELLGYYGVEIAGKECVIVGRSNIVGKPMALLLLAKNGTVSVCHSRTRDLSEHTRRADILVVAVGKPEFITADMVKEDAVVIDVGINRMEDGRVVGDVSFSDVADRASMITPVPGGVGPMTITMLLKNTLNAAKRRILK